MMSRWQRAKEWVVLHSKSKPAQICLSLAAGGSFASGMYYISQLFMGLLTPGTALFVVLEIVEAILITSSFIATTALTASGLSVSIAGADRHDENIAQHTEEFKKIKPLLHNLSEAIHYLLEKDKAHSAAGNHNTHLLQQLMKITGILSQYVPDAEEKMICQTALTLPPAFIPAQPLDLAIQYEPYFSEQSPTSQREASPLDPEDDIEMGTVRRYGTQGVANYGAFFSRSSSSSMTRPMLERADSENDLVEIPLERLASL